MVRIASRFLTKAGLIELVRTLGKKDDSGFIDDIKASSVVEVPHKKPSSTLSFSETPRLVLNQTLCDGLGWDSDWGRRSDRHHGTATDYP